MRFLAFSLILPVAAGVALAAQPTARPEDGQRPDMAQMRAHFAEMRQKRADDIALLIGLRPEQRPALDAMLASMAKPRGPHGPGSQPAEAGPPPPPPIPVDAGFLARLDAAAAHIDSHDEQAKQALAAARAFYTGLDPDQKRRFEALDELRRIDMPGGGMHRMRGPGPDGGHDGPPPPPPAN